MGNDKIKWGCIQPLTGGMYLGTEKAIGHPAEWIISYPGLTDVKMTKDGKVGYVGNEYNLLQYLKLHNRLPDYYIFNKKPFEDIDINDVEITNSSEWNSNNENSIFDNINDIDIVVSVPVCSGLSQATIASDDTKHARNCNMLWNAKWVLKVVCPKVYIFENAPTLFTGNAGKSVRETLSCLAKECGYSIIFYKTDTKLHDNCQRRPRTFVVFVKYNNGTGAPEMLWEDIKCNMKEYMERIPKDADQQETVDMTPGNILLYNYIKDRYGKDYRENTTTSWSIGNIIDNNKWDDFYDYISKYDCKQDVKDKLYHICEHIKYKLSLGKNFYVLVPSWSKESDETVPACMFKAVPTLIHYKEDRLYTIREWLHLMGHPHDFKMYGDINMNYSKIGQNVPVNTARWIVSESVRLVKNWDIIDRSGKTDRYFDNTKKRELL